MKKMCRFKILSVLILNVLCVINYANAAGISPRVIGGSPVILGSAPYHASLRNVVQNTHVCGGAIISNNAIISAAHCFPEGVLPEHVIAVLGTSRLSEPGDRYEIAQIINHEEYSNVTRRHDISIVTTTQEIIFTRKVRPIALWKKFIPSGNLLFTGYGHITSSGTDPTDLMQIVLNVLNWDTCKRAYANVLRREIFASQICTYNGFNEGTCKGDSGAALVKNDVLVGIASFGVPCAIGMPDVFTRTSDYVKWVKERVPSMMYNANLPQ